MPTHRDMCALAHTQGRKIAKELRFFFGKPIPSSVCRKIAWCYWFSFPHLCVRWDRPVTCTRTSSLKPYYCLALPPNLARALGAALLLMEFSSFLPYSFFFATHTIKISVHAPPPCLLCMHLTISCKRISFHLIVLFLVVVGSFLWMRAHCVYSLCCYVIYAAIRWKQVKKKRWMLFNCGANITGCGGGIILCVLFEILNGHFEG